MRGRPSSSLLCLTAEPVPVRTPVGPLDVYFAARCFMGFDVPALTIRCICGWELPMADTLGAVPESSWPKLLEGARRCQFAHLRGHFREELEEMDAVHGPAFRERLRDGLVSPSRRD